MKCNNQREPKHGDNWRRNLRDSSLRFGFSVTLSQAMLEMLCAVADDCQWNRSLVTSIHCPDNFLASTFALLRRGLIREIHKSRKAEVWENNRKTARGMSRSWYELTPAGKHIVEVCKLAGVFVETVASAVRAAKRAG